MFLPKNRLYLSLIVFYDLLSKKTQKADTQEMVTRQIMKKITRTVDKVDKSTALVNNSNFSFLTGKSSVY